jgi:branched-chain amino acid transport system permease protein
MKTSQDHPTSSTTLISFLAKFPTHVLAPILSPLIAIILLSGFAFYLDAFANGYVQRILLYVLANSILALSLNLVSGFTGQFSLGHAGFATIGGYMSAWLSMLPMVAGFRASAGPGDFLIFIPCTLAGGLLAAVFGLIVGIPSLRLRGDYLAIVTLGFGEITRVILLNIKSVGGALGLSQLPTPSGFDLGPIKVSPFIVLFCYGAIFATLTFTVLWRLTRSIHGRIYLSVREDELAAEAMGVNTTRTKVTAFVLSSFFAGIAGSFLSMAVGGLNPTSAAFSRSVDVIIMVVLGGLGSLSGSLLAAIVVTIVPEFVLRPLQDYTGVDLRMIIYSLILILFMILRPKGIFGTHEIYDMFQKWQKCEVRG